MNISYYEYIQGLLVTIYTRSKWQTDIVTPPNWITLSALKENIHLKILQVTKVTKDVILIIYAFQDEIKKYPIRKLFCNEIEKFYDFLCYWKKIMPFQC